MQKLNSFRNEKPVIAIDGTAGSGKGTLAKNIANFLEFDHLDSGLLYRIFAYEFLNQKVGFEKIEKVKPNFKEFFRQKKKIDLRSQKITEIASKIAKEKKVRDSMIFFQREFANNPPTGRGSVIDGRDITSKIVPNAEVKFYVDADLSIRATRRLKQMQLDQVYYQEILENIDQRDENDKNRKESPLLRTKDSFFIDTSKINEKKVLEVAIKYIKQKIDYI